LLLRLFRPFQFCALALRAYHSTTRGSIHCHLQLGCFFVPWLAFILII